MTAGNCLNIDNCMFNIFNPYPLSDVPSKFLHTQEEIQTESSKDLPIKGIRSKIYPLKIEALPEDGKPIFLNNHHYNQSNENNQSIVTKLICGKKKVLFMGDAGFPTEEILLGKVPEEMANYDGNLTYSPPVSTKTVVVDKKTNKTEEFKCIDTTKKGYSTTFGYNTSSNGENPGLGIGWSNSYKHGDTIEVTTYMNLIKDIMNAEKFTNTSTISNEYKLQRLTKKDISADVLKRGHHGIGNTTSYSFLAEVKPDQIISTGSEKYGVYNKSNTDIKSNSLVSFVDEPADYRIRMYYKNIKKIELNKGETNEKKYNYFLKYVYGPSNSTEANYNKISITNGIEVKKIK